MREEEEEEAAAERRHTHGVDVSDEFKFYWKRRKMHTYARAGEHKQETINKSRGRTTTTTTYELWNRKRFPNHWKESSSINPN